MPDPHLSTPVMEIPGMMDPAVGSLGIAPPLMGAPGMVSPPTMLLLGMRTPDMDPPGMPGFLPPGAVPPSVIPPTCKLQVMLCHKVSAVGPQAFLVLQAKILNLRQRGSTDLHNMPLNKHQIKFSMGFAKDSLTCAYYNFVNGTVLELSDFEITYVVHFITIFLIPLSTRHYGAIIVDFVNCKLLLGNSVGGFTFPDDLADHMHWLLADVSTFDTKTFAVEDAAVPKQGSGSESCAINSFATFQHLVIPQNIPQ
ncbi:hypothetical protein PsorP6_000690 [Peronosclerospora sorghi]|uniref:Uncharacterized protein n=1 Tax=Peronosclerospora sorghi TaxID=230839 RepID=A0ACC0WTS5_9STRA|nr:hypothetical protein PsorP6_000690 [Peronosclerospora sorghi]